MRRTILIAALLALAGAFGAVPARASSPCVYHGQTKVVTVNMNDRFELKITRSGSRISIVSDNTPYMCEAATVQNTNRIDIIGTAASADVIGSTIVELDLGSGRLGPGASHESTGESEIEIRIKVTPGHSVFDPFGPLPLEIYYFGSSGADVAIAGARGIDMNGDGDVDVKSLVAPIARYSFYGEAGPDRLSGAGSGVTGAAVTGRVVTRGGEGRDVLRGGSASDVLLPEGGADKVFGGDGDDTMVSYALDGADVLNGGSGHDIADFGSRSDALEINLNGFADDGAPGEHDNVGPANDVEEVVGGSGNDILTAENFGVTNVLNGGAGSDIFHTVDTGGDTIDGGDDADEAFVDDVIDTTTNVETVHSTT